MQFMADKYGPPKMAVLFLLTIGPNESPTRFVMQVVGKEQEMITQLWPLLNVSMVACASFATLFGRKGPYDIIHHGTLKTRDCYLKTEYGRELGDQARETIRKLSMRRMDARPFDDFDDALLYARSLKLNGQKEWQEWCKSGVRKANIPSNPNQTYKHEGWRGYRHWLGTGKHSKKVKRT